MQGVLRPNWWIDELIYAGEEHLDTDYVAGYDRKAQTDPTADIELLRELGMNETSTVVDLGAGTGTFALAIAPYCRRVVAVDVSPAMLTTLRDNARHAGIDNLEVAHAGFLSYAHQGDPVDVVYSRNALHHLPDFWKVVALDRIAVLLCPGGILRLHDLAFACEPHEVTAMVEDWLAHAATSPGIGWTREELEIHLRTEYSTFTWLLEPMLDRAGFDIRDASYRPARPYAAYTCIKRGG